MTFLQKFLFKAITSQNMTGSTRIDEKSHHPEQQCHMTLCNRQLRV
jgi:hypothetical protein